MSPLLQLGVSSLLGWAGQWWQDRRSAKVFKEIQQRDAEASRQMAAHARMSTVRLQNLLGSGVFSGGNLNAAMPPPSWRTQTTAPLVVVPRAGYSTGEESFSQQSVGISGLPKQRVSRQESNEEMFQRMLKEVTWI